MLTHFLDLLAVVISVTSLLIVTYGALIGIILFCRMKYDALPEGIPLPIYEN